MNPEEPTPEYPAFDTLDRHDADSAPTFANQTRHPDEDCQDALFDCYNE